MLCEQSIKCIVLWLFSIPVVLCAALTDPSSLYFVPRLLQSIFKMNPSHSALLMTVTIWYAGLLLIWTLAVLFTTDTDCAKAAAPEEKKRNSFDFPQLSLCTLSLCNDFLHFPEWLLSNCRECVWPWCFCAQRQSSSNREKVRFYSKEKVGASPLTWTETSAALYSGLLRLL